MADFLASIFSIAAITLPIAALVLLGLISVRLEWFDGNGVPHLARFVTHFGLPAAVFLVIATQDLETLLNLGFFKAYGLGTVAAGLLLISLLLALGRGATHAGISWIGGTSCNCMMIGIAITPVLLGGNAVAVMGMVSFFQDVFILPFALMLAEVGRGGNWRTSFVSALVRNLKSPLIIGIALGFVVAALPFDLPAPVSRSIELLAASLAGVGLFMIGALLARRKMTGTLKKIAPVFATKLGIHPLSVGLAFWAFPIEVTTMMLAGILASSLPMVAIYSAYGLQYGEGEDAAATTLTATLASALTIAIVMAIAIPIFG